VQRASEGFVDGGRLNERIVLAACEVLLSPPSDAGPTLDAAAAFQRAAQRGVASTGRAAVFSAMATTRRNWIDDGPAERLVYVVRWDNLSWVPSGPPCPDGRGRGPAIGTRTVIIEAETGSVLLDRLRGTTGRPAVSSDR
jgi:hypothetical protein